jgi:hypothetical protein
MKKETKKNEHTVTTADVDKFGSRLGSDAAKANAVLTKKPKKMAEIVKEGDLNGTVYQHLNALASKGLIKKTKEGYALKN